MRTLCLGLASVAALTVFATPAVAAQETAQPTQHREQIVIINRTGDNAGMADAAHRLRVLREGDLASHCTGQKDEVDEASGDGRERTRIMVCGDNQLSAADRAAKLEQVLGRIEARDDMSADQKARVTTALRGAIERMRAGQ